MRPPRSSARARVPPKARRRSRPWTAASEGPDPQTLAEIRRFKSVNQDQAAELSRLKAALITYEAADNDDRGVKESKIAMKARLSALKALTDEQSGTIHSLRAELAAGNEKLARQAAYFMEEMRRLGSGTVPASGPARRSGAQAAEAAQAPARRAHQRSARCASRAFWTGRRRSGCRRRCQRSGAAPRQRLPQGARCGVDSRRRRVSSTRPATEASAADAGGARGQAHAQGAAARPHHRSRQELRLR